MAHRASTSIGGMSGLVPDPEGRAIPRRCAVGTRRAARVLDGVGQHCGIRRGGSGASPSRARGENEIETV
jgi:hypothetical protein